MELNYKSSDDKRNEQFISLFAFGIINALKENLITCDDAWNWLLNIRTLETLEKEKFNTDIINAIHLGTELENVKRIVPYAFVNSCDEILEILKKILEKKSFAVEEIDYLLEVKF